MVFHRLSLTVGKHITSDLCFVAVASLGFGNRRSEAYATGKASHCAGLAFFLDITSSLFRSLKKCLIYSVAFIFDMYLLVLCFVSFQMSFLLLSIKMSLLTRTLVKKNHSHSRNEIPFTQTMLYFRFYYCPWLNPNIIQIPCCLFIHIYDMTHVWH